MALWTPLNLGPQLAAWFDPSDASYVQFDATNVNNVARIYNKSPNGGVGNLTAYNTGAGPTYSATARNGKPGLIFAANSKMVTTGLVTGTTPTVVCIVGQATTTGYRAAFAQGTTNVRVLGIRNSPNYVYVSNKSGSDINSTVVWLNNDVICVGAWDASGEYLALNGGGLLTRAVASAVDAATAYIGAYNAGDVSGFTGVIQQIVIVNGTLTDDMRARLEGWSAWATGNQAKLPAGHVYAAAPPNVDNNFASAFNFTDDTVSQGSVAIQITASMTNILADAVSVGRIATSIKASSLLYIEDVKSLGAISSNNKLSGVNILDDVRSLAAVNASITAQGITTLNDAASISNVAITIKAVSYYKLDDAKTNANVIVSNTAVSVVTLDECKTSAEMFSTLAAASIIILEGAKTYGVLETSKLGNQAVSLITLDNALSRSLLHLTAEAYAIIDETSKANSEITTVMANVEITQTIAKGG